MPFAPPPTAGLKAKPVDHILPQGTELWRVHSSSYASTAFNPTRAHKYFGGGRFDGTDDDPYAYIYVGPTEQSAVAETFLRDLAFDSSGVRCVPAASYKGRCLSNVQTTADLTLLSLWDTVALASVCQDSWIIDAETIQYAQTRHWGHWYRKQVDWAQGVYWPSKRDTGNYAVVLFEDRCPAGTLIAGGTTYDFDTPAGRQELENVLKPLNTVV